MVPFAAIDLASAMIERIAWAAARRAIVEAALRVETGLRALRRINPEYTNMQATKSDGVVVHGYRDR
jgi:hypothetical protein